jgi:hypothetical protein
MGLDFEECWCRICHALDRVPPAQGATPGGPDADPASRTEDRVPGRRGCACPARGFLRGRCRQESAAAGCVPRCSGEEMMDENTGNAASAPCCAEPGTSCDCAAPRRRSWLKTLIAAAILLAAIGVGAYSLLAGPKAGGDAAGNHPATPPAAAKAAAPPPNTAPPPCCGGGAPAAQPRPACCGGAPAAEPRPACGGGAAAPAAAPAVEPKCGSRPSCCGGH